MPAWMSRKPLPTRFLWEIAIAGALAFHALLLFLLRAEPVTAVKTRAPQQPRCVLLPADGATGGWEKQLYTWVRLEDPTLLTLPNSRRGFSGCLREKADLPVAAPPAHTPQPATTGQTEFPPLVLAHKPEPLGDGLVRNWRLAPPAVAATSPGTPVPHSVVWRFADGTPVPRMPEPASAEVGQALSQGAPQGPTRIEMTLPRTGTGTARFHLVESSGNPALDRLALQQMAQRAGDWERNNLFRKAATESDRFLPENGFTETIEVEWRMVGAEAEKK